jgi:hypothetical protein
MKGNGLRHSPGPVVHIAVPHGLERADGGGYLLAP